MVDCKPDTTHSDEKYEPTQLYYGTYQPSQNVLFYNNNSDSELNFVSIGFVIIDSEFTSDKAAQAIIELLAFDSGKIIKVFIILV
jgi:hypothetical protein